jgi:glycosyltransferase involved in cell wall biosynthesis
MNKNNLISVIIPTFNRSHFITEAVDSVLNQDIQGYDIEVLVIDDGSTDNTREVLKKYHDKIRYIYQNNGGAGVARNRGLEEARGEWITFLDSDDLWLPFKLSLQMSIIQKIPQCKILYGNFRVFNEDGVLFEKGVDYWAQYLGLSNYADWKEMFSEKLESSDIGVTYKGRSFTIHKGNLFGGIIFQPCIPCWTSIISRDCISDKIRFAEHYPTWEDLWFFCLLAEENEIYFMDFCIAENRGHTGPRLTQVDNVKRLKCHIDICENIYFTSGSPYRPAEIELNTLYAELHKDLFKEYLKKSLYREASDVKDKLDKMEFVSKDISYLFYKIGFLIPGNPIRHLVKLKSLIIRD